MGGGSGNLELVPSNRSAAFPLLKPTPPRRPLPPLGGASTGYVGLVLDVWAHLRDNAGVLVAPRQPFWEPVGDNLRDKTSFTSFATGVEATAVRRLHLTGLPLIKVRELIL